METNPTGADNTDAHLLQFGHGSVAVEMCGRPTTVESVKRLRPWEQIFYGEFDGNRAKRVLIKVIGE